MSPTVGEQADVRWPNGGLVIVERNGGGHRFWYVSMLLERARAEEPSCRLTLVTSRRALSEPGYAMYIARTKDRLRLEVVSDGAPRWALLLRLARGRSHVCIPDADEWLLGLLVARVLSRGFLRGVALRLRPDPAPNTPGRLRHVLKRSASFLVRSKEFQVLLLRSDEISGTDDVLDPIAFAPGDIPEMLADKRERRTLAILGDVSQRKFAPELIEAISSKYARQQLPEWRLALIGQLDEATRKHAELAAASHPNRLVIVNAFLEEKEFDAWVAHADAVAVLHRNVGSSGILLKCWVAGTPVIVGGTPELVEAAATLELPRVAVSTTKATELVAALLALPARQRHLSPEGWSDRRRIFEERLLGLGRKQSSTGGFRW